MPGHFEAKKHAYRQTQDGIVVSFVIHPNDLDATFAIAPLGTRYMVGFAEIGDDGGPVVQEEELPVAQVDAVSTTASPPKEKRPFASLPLSQQAALRCQDNDFKLFLDASDADDAAEMVRKHCAVKSRSELDNPRNDWPRSHWQSLESQYQSWLVTRQYKDAVR